MGSLAAAALLCLAAALAAPLAGGHAPDHGGAQQHGALPEWVPAAGAAGWDRGCAQDLVPVARASDGSIACVRQSTASVLADRGWGEDPPDGWHAGEGMRRPEESSPVPDVRDAGEGHRGGAGGGHAGAGDGGHGRGAGAGMAVDLTEAEAGWLEDNPVIRVAYDPHFPPYEYADESGELAGIPPPLMRHVEEATGAVFEPVSTGSWSESLDAVRGGEADVLFIVGETEERRGFMDFTAPYLAVSWDMMTLGGADVDPEDLGSLRVGTIRDYEIEAWLDANRPEVEYTSFDGQRAALAALQSGRIDVLVDAGAAAAHHAAAMGIKGLRNAGPAGHSLETSVGYAKGEAELGSILQKALDALPEGEIQMIAARAAFDHAVTGAEEAWLEDNPVVRVGYDPGWEPYEYLDGSGGLAGLTGAYARVFERVTGADFAPIDSSSWSESLGAVRGGEADVLFMVGETAERRGFMGFTSPHTTLSWDVMTLDPGADPGDLGSLRVGTIRDYEIEAWLDANRPDVGYTSFDDHAAALDALRSGGIDAFVEVETVAAHHAAAMGIEGLRNAGPAGHDIDLSIGYARDKAELGSVLQKALDAVPEAARPSVAAGVPGGH